MVISEALSQANFLQFVYPEVKDLCKHFLTLVSGVLVFSVTFAEKILVIGAASRGQKLILFSAWIFFVLAFVLGGASLTGLFLAAGRAKAMEPWEDLMITSGNTLFTAGASFALGLIAIVIAGSFALFRKHSNA